MNDQAASTPSTQQQHHPPSLPASPHPKRIKTDDLLNSTASTPTITTLPTMSGRPSQPGVPVDQASTPTPSNPNPSSTSDHSTLPPVSSLLPSISSNPPMIQNSGFAIGQPTFAATGTSVPPVAAAPPLLVKKLSANATIPTRGSAFAAGYDLYAASPITLKSKSKGLVSTDIAISVPAGTYGRVAPRSGLASKHFLDTGAGVIDADYRGEVKVLMFNFSDVDYEVKQGERIAQLVLERIITPEVIEVETLEDSVRGAGGFGSTGRI